MFNVDKLGKPSIIGSVLTVIPHVLGGGVKSVDLPDLLNLWVCPVYTSFYFFYVSKQGKPDNFNFRNDNWHTNKLQLNRLNNYLLY